MPRLAKFVCFHILLVNVIEPTGSEHILLSNFDCSDDWESTTSNTTRNEVTFEAVSKIMRIGYRVAFDVNRRSYVEVRRVNDFGTANLEGCSEISFRYRVQQSNDYSRNAAFLLTLITVDEHGLKRKGYATVFKILGRQSNDWINASRKLADFVTANTNNMTFIGTPMKTSPSYSRVVSFSFAVTIGNSDYRVTEVVNAEGIVWLEDFRCSGTNALQSAFLANGLQSWLVESSTPGIRVEPLLASHLQKGEAIAEPKPLSISHSPRSQQCPLEDEGDDENVPTSEVGSHAVVRHALPERFFYDLSDERVQGISFDVWLESPNLKCTLHLALLTECDFEESMRKVRKCSGAISRDRAFCTPVYQPLVRTITIDSSQGKTVGHLYLRGGSPRRIRGFRLNATFHSGDARNFSLSFGNMSSFPDEGLDEFPKASHVKEPLLYFELFNSNTHMASHSAAEVWTPDECADLCQQHDSCIFFTFRLPRNVINCVLATFVPKDRIIMRDKNFSTMKQHFPRYFCSGWMNERRPKACSTTSDGRVDGSARCGCEKTTLTGLRVACADPNLTILPELPEGIEILNLTGSSVSFLTKKLVGYQAELRELWLGDALGFVEPGLLQDYLPKIERLESSSKLMGNTRLNDGAFSDICCDNSNELTFGNTTLSHCVLRADDYVGCKFVEGQEIKLGTGSVYFEYDLQGLDVSACCKKCESRPNCTHWTRDARDTGVVCRLYDFGDDTPAFLPAEPAVISGNKTSKGLQLNVGPNAKPSKHKPPRYELDVRNTTSMRGSYEIILSLPTDMELRGNVKFTTDIKPKPGCNFPRGNNPSVSMTEQYLRENSLVSKFVVDCTNLLGKRVFEVKHTILDACDDIVRNFHGEVRVEVTSFGLCRKDHICLNDCNKGDPCPDGSTSPAHWTRETDSNVCKCGPRMTMMLDNSCRCDPSFRNESNTCIRCFNHPFDLVGDFLLKKTYVIDDPPCSTDMEKVIVIIVLTILAICSVGFLPLLFGIAVPIDDISTEGIDSDAHETLSTTISVNSRPQPESLVRLHTATPHFVLFKRHCRVLLEGVVPNRPKVIALVQANDLYSLHILAIENVDDELCLESAQGSMRLVSSDSARTAGIGVIPAFMLILTSLIVHVTMIVLTNPSSEKKIEFMAFVFVITMPFLFCIPCWCGYKGRRTLLRRAVKFYQTAVERRVPQAQLCAPGPQRAISCEDLLRFHDAFRHIIRGRNMYFIEHNIIRAVTKHQKSSFAEYVGCGTLDWFVSHYWGMPFIATLDSLFLHAKRRQPANWRNVRFWICTFSNNQWNMVEEIPSGGVQQTSFYKALSHTSCKGTCMVVDCNVIPLQRSWCLFELLHTFLRAKDGGDQDEQMVGIVSEVSTCLPFSGLNLVTPSGVLNDGIASFDLAIAIGDTIANLKLEDATASREEDKEMIQREVLHYFGSFHAVNRELSGRIQESLLQVEARATTQIKSLKERISASSALSERALPGGAPTNFADHALVVPRTLLPKPTFSPSPICPIQGRRDEDEDEDVDEGELDGVLI
eukprot:TRINITY_DN7359_c0_g1_i5.p1 TRINITY_DN7359_c0_g1~~TRINITY_DN7359_c0_g1_i5.p1  ORF type:complete len:1535 (+),score=188.78 TRINITY_DN7359_c0_g1_i5:77-4681(+)